LYPWAHELLCGEYFFTENQNNLICFDSYIMTT